MYVKSQETLLQLCQLKSIVLFKEVQQCFFKLVEHLEHQFLPQMQKGCKLRSQPKLQNSCVFLFFLLLLFLLFFLSFSHMKNIQMGKSHGDIFFPVSERMNNFPPLPQFLKIKPCFYQNIEEEIPDSYQQLVQRIFMLWKSKCFHIHFLFL